MDLPDRPRGPGLVRDPYRAANASTLLLVLATIALVVLEHSLPGPR